LNLEWPEFLGKVAGEFFERLLRYVVVQQLAPPLEKVPLMLVTWPERRSIIRGRSRAVRTIGARMPTSKTRRISAVGVSNSSRPWKARPASCQALATFAITNISPKAESPAASSSTAATSVEIGDMHGGAAAGRLHQLGCFLERAARARDEIDRRAAAGICDRQGPTDADARARDDAALTFQVHGHVLFS
jgi:hypothetical protein